MCLLSVWNVVLLSTAPHALSPECTHTSFAMCSTGRLASSSRTRAQSVRFQCATRLLSSESAVMLADAELLGLLVVFLWLRVICF